MRTKQGQGTTRNGKGCEDEHMITLDSSGSDAGGFFRPPVSVEKNNDVHIVTTHLITSGRFLFYRQIFAAISGQSGRRSLSLGFLSGWFSSDVCRSATRSSEEKAYDGSCQGGKTHNGSCVCAWHVFNVAYWEDGI